MYFVKLAGAGNVTVQEDRSGVPEDAISAVCTIAEAYIPLGSLIDIDKEIERVNRELEHMQSEIKRYEGKLNNPGFVGKAPANVVEAERKKLEDAQAVVAKLNERLDQLKNI